MYGGRGLAELAGCDSLQLAQVYGRPRDKSGNLLRNGRSVTPADGKEVPWVKVVKNPDKDGYKGVFWWTWKRRGLEEEQINQKWQTYLESLSPQTRARLTRPDLNSGGRVIRPASRGQFTGKSRRRSPKEPV